MLIFIHRSQKNEITATATRLPLPLPQITERGRKRGGKRGGKRAHRREERAGRAAMQRGGGDGRWRRAREVARSICSNDGRWRWAVAMSRGGSAVDLQRQWAVATSRGGGAIGRPGGVSVLWSVTGTGKEERYILRAFSRGWSHQPGLKAWLPAAWPGENSPLVPVGGSNRD